MLTRIQIYMDYDAPVSVDGDEYRGAVVEFHGTNVITDQFCVPYPRSAVLKEYVAPLCLKDWLNTRLPWDYDAPKDSVREMPIVRVRAIDISAGKDDVCVEFIGPEGTDARYFHVPYPRGRILLEYVARVIIEERVDIALAGSSSGTVFFPDKDDKTLKAAQQPVREAAE